MDDLLPPQIKDSCKLALPDGLKELMSDISREVLRYQPRDLYKFIADYLSALLITRDNLCMASYICKDILECCCEPELQTELRDIGLPEDDIKTARDIIVKYLEKGPVQESNLLMRLLRETNIDEDMMPAVQDAIRNAFLRHQAHNTTVYESSSDSERDETMCAAKHTLDLYRKTAPTEETYGIMAEKIQKSYRAYGVRRDCKIKDSIIPRTPKAKHTTSAENSVTLIDPNLIPQMSCCHDTAFPKTIFSEERTSVRSMSEEASFFYERTTLDRKEKGSDPDIQISSSMNQKRITTISSTSVAGSFVYLPSFKPYSVHDSEILSDLEEYPEKEHAFIDYTADSPHISMLTEDKLFHERDDGNNIPFNQNVRVSLEVDNDSESKDSNQNKPSMKADAGIFSRGNVMRTESNYDGDVEIEQRYIIIDECDDNNDDKFLEQH